MSYEAGGRAIHVPLASDHPLVVVLGEALGEKVPAGARDVAEALLEEALALQVRAPIFMTCSNYMHNVNLQGV